MRLSPRFPGHGKADSCPPHTPALIQGQRVSCLMSGRHVDSLTFTVFSRSFFSVLRGHLKGQVITSLLGSKNSNVSPFLKPSEHPRPALQIFLMFSFLPIYLAFQGHKSLSFPQTPTALSYTCFCICCFPMPRMLSPSSVYDCKVKKIIQENTLAETL